MSTPSAKSMWQPTIPVNQSIYEDDTTQNAPLGTLLTVGDRTFVYAGVSASVDGGVLVAMPAYSGTSDELVSCTGTAGDNFLTITAGTDMTANAYAEGYLYAQTVTSGVKTYRVKSHSSIGSAGTGTVTLYDDLNEAIVAADTVGIAQNKFKALAAATADEPVVGVTPCECTASSYCWLQIDGPVSIKCANGETLTRGSVVVPATGGGGADIAGTANTDVQTGIVLGVDATTGESTLIDLRL